MKNNLLVLLITCLIAGIAPSAFGDYGRRRPPRPRPPQKTPLPPQPHRVSPEDIEWNVRVFKKDLKACHQHVQRDTTLTLRWLVHSNGRVTGLSTVTPIEQRESPLAKCAEGVIQKILFPQFHGEPFEVNYPFTFKLSGEVEEGTPTVQTVPEAGGCACPDDAYAPVCGANQITYAHACHAVCQKVEIAHPGACKPRRD